MSQMQTDEYAKLDAEITELTFQRAFPTQKLRQDQWELLQEQILEKVKQRDLLRVK